MNYKVSIIVPVYNVQKYIHKCIDSILSQNGINPDSIEINFATKNLSNEEYTIC